MPDLKKYTATNTEDLEPFRRQRHILKPTDIHSRKIQTTDSITSSVLVPRWNYASPKLPSLTNLLVGILHQLNGTGLVNRCTTIQSNQATLQRIRQTPKHHLHHHNIILCTLHLEVNPLDLHRNTVIWGKALTRVLRMNGLQKAHL